MKPGRILTMAVLASAALLAQAPQHGVRPARLVIRHAMLVEGNGTPARGPVDITIEGNRVTGIGRAEAGAVEIEAQGKYVIPGLVNLHGHLHDQRGGVPLPPDYVLKLWLACGITTVRDVGSNMQLTLAMRRKSAAGEVAAPRLFVYPMFQQKVAARTPEEARRRVQEIQAAGADGMKMLGEHRDLMEAAVTEARKLGLRVAHHAGVEETNAWDDIRLGVTSIEHWYGIPDAALADGVQNFPPEYNYNDEVDRFRYAGRLWREASWDRLMNVFDAMIEAHVAWDPTLDIYEASRDVQRAQTQPWFADYLHPVLARFFEPNRQSHGSYFIGWTSTDETYWKENYRIWMKALREFGRRGGLIGLGEDAGYIYQMYGFGLLRGMELHQEAGFHPLQVIEQATLNGARILGEEGRLGRVREGWTADLLVVNGNPLADLKALNPTAAAGGIEWTVKDGIPYHVPRLMQEVKAMVAAARESTHSP